MTFRRPPRTDQEPILDAAPPTGASDDAAPRFAFGFQARLTLAVACLLLLTVLAVAWSSDRTVRTLHERGVLASLRLAARASAVHVRHWLDGQAGTIGTIAATEALVAGVRDALQAPAGSTGRLRHAALLEARLEELVRAHHAILALSLHDAATGERLAAGGASAAAIMLEPRHGEAVRRGAAGVWFSEADAWPGDGAPSMLIAVPVRNEGMTLAVLLAHVEATSLTREILHGTSMGPALDGHETCLVDRRGLADDPRATVLEAWSPVEGTGWLCISEIDRDEAMRPLQHLRNQLLLISSGIALLSCLVAAGLARPLLAPLATITAAARRLAAGERSVRCGLRRGDELGALADSFDRMADALERTLGELEAEDRHRRRIEEALRVSDERFELAVRGSSDGLWDWHVGTDRVWYTTRFGELLGFAAGEFPESFAAWQERLHPDDRQRTQDAVQRALRGEAPYMIEYRLQTKSGAYRWFLVRGVAVHDAGGRPVRMAGSIQDIEDRSSAERALTEAHAELRSSEERFRSVVENVPGVIYRCGVDSSRPVELITGAVEQLSGYPSQRFVAAGRTLSSIVHPHDRDAVMAAISGSVRRGEAFKLEYRVVRSDGTIRWIHEKGRPLPLDGEPRWVDGVILDVTERRQTELALQEAGEHLHLTLAATQIGTWIGSLDDGSVTWDDRMHAIFGIAREQFANTYDGSLEMVHPDDAELVRQAVRRSLLDDDELDLEFRVVRPDGEVRHVTSRAAMLRDDHGQARRILGVCLDTTERRLADQAGRERQHLQEAVRAMQQVLGVVGHELRTPLAAVRAASELLSSEPGLDAAQSRIFIDSIHDEVVRMAQMVNNMLEAARLNSGSARWNWSIVTVGAACDEALATIQALVDRTQVQLHSRVEPPDLTMRGDPDAIRRLLVNLLSNAARHTTAGSIEVGAAAGAGGTVVITVDDTGAGIAGETVEKLGKAFVLNSGVVGEQYVKGSGLGLAICKGIVAAHGGTISVASAERRGTRFTITLRADLAGPVTLGADELEICQEAA